jgi:hypothetical protein
MNNKLNRGQIDTLEELIELLFDEIEMDIDTIKRIESAIEKAKGREFIESMKKIDI